MELINNLVVASSLTDWVGDFVGDVGTLIQVILGVVGAIVAVVIIVKNPTVGRSIMGVLVGAFIAALPWLVTNVGEMIRGDVEASAQVSTVDEEANHRASTFEI